MPGNTPKPLQGNAGKGRKKGVPNKTTTAVKQALIQAFEEIGGVAELVAWGKQKRNRSEFYKLWVKILPVELKNADGEAFRIVIAEEIVGADTSEDGPPPPGSAPVPPQ